MSASSNCVTCGIITQLRARLAPEIFLIRDSGCDSTGPNFAKSTFGHGRRSRPAAAAPRRCRGAPLMTPFTKPCTSSCRMRAVRSGACAPSTRSTPSSRANLRTEGDACAAVNATSSHRPRDARSRDAGEGRRRAGGALASAACGGRCEAAGACAAGGGAGGGAGGAARGRLCRAGVAPPRAMSTRLPSLTLSPTLTFISFTTPATGAGTSIVALSDSSVTSASSALTCRPAFTSTSMTGMSLKSPMSGTLTSMCSSIATEPRKARCVRGQRRRASVTLRPSTAPACRVEAVLRDRFGDLGHRDRAFVGQRLQRRHRRRNADSTSKKSTQLLARVGAPEAIGAEHDDTRRGTQRRGSARRTAACSRSPRSPGPAVVLEARLDVRACAASRVGCSMFQRVDGVAVARELGERRAAPDIGLDAPIVLQQVGGGDRLRAGSTPDPSSCTRGALPSPWRLRCSLYMPLRMFGAAPSGIAGCV